MKNDSIKKYLIPNIPYLFVLWAFLKLGTAYRLAAGADFAHKLMGLGQTIGPAFADFAPGLAPFDWLVGIVIKATKLSESRTVIRKLSFAPRSRAALSLSMVAQFLRCRGTLFFCYSGAFFGRSRSPFH